MDNLSDFKGDASKNRKFKLDIIPKIQSHTYNQ